MWCWCFYHLTNLRVGHVVVTDCRKIKIYSTGVFSNYMLFTSSFTKMLDRVES